MKELIKIYKKYNRPALITVLFGVLLVYFLYVCYLNFSLTPGFYCTDMYSDVLYSVRAWESKSIFPDGWVFGNQFYVIATPVLAALIYGIVGHPALAMAIATVLMSLGVAFSLLWMLKPVFPRIEVRLIALISFVALPAFCGDAIYSVNGWQLFFTMSSYYSCYLITAFLCFGCFLRRREALTKPRIAMLVIASILAFGSGMQSLRQTAIMLPPMLLIEGFFQTKTLIKEKKIEKQPLLVTGVITFSNLSGLLLIRLLNVPHHEIFSSAALLESNALPDPCNKTLLNMASLLTDSEHYGILLLMIATIAVLAFFQAKWQKEPSFGNFGTLFSLLSVSVLVIALLDVFTKMSIRSIYYFILFPLVTLLPAYAYSKWRLGKVFALVVLTILVIGSFNSAILPASKDAAKAEESISHEVSDLLIEKGYTTIYSGWNQCEDIAIASGGKLTAGFWDRSTDVFRPVTYLCDPSIYEVESNKCVYYLRKDNLEIALSTAKERGVTMTLVANYSAWGFMIYEASENLMEIPDN